jgi:ParE toxin of type II toxin-antitoxin system, parDE
MKRYKVQTSSSARGQIAAASAFWNKNRPYNPKLFREELAEASGRLAILPAAGEVYAAHPKGEVRRMLLPRTQYCVYYVIDEAARLVTVLAVWHTARCRAPKL